MRRPLHLALLLALSLALTGSQCEGPKEVPLAELRADVEPPFDYGLYCDAHGRLVGDTAAVYLVHRSAHLERVYADAQAGKVRAQVLFKQLRHVAAATGIQLAAKELNPLCAAHPTCTVHWAKLDEFMPVKGPGAEQLRYALNLGFKEKARLMGVHNAVLVGAANVAMVGGPLKAALGAEAKATATEARIAATEAQATAAEAREARTAATEARASASEARATATEARAHGGQEAAESPAGRLLSAQVAEAQALEQAAALESLAQEIEALETGPRYAGNLRELARHRPALDKPPPGVAPGDTLWGEYVAYWEGRYAELTGARPRSAWLPPAKPPLLWGNYASFQNRVRRAIALQRDVSEALRREVALPPWQRQYLGDLEQPLLADNVGLGHRGTPARTYVDQLAVDRASLQPGRKPLVHSFSNKQREFTGLNEEGIRAQARADMVEATTKYGETVEIRRPGHPLFGQQVGVTRVHLVYDGKPLTPRIREIIIDQARRLGVEVHFHE